MQRESVYVLQEAQLHLQDGSMCSNEMYPQYLMPTGTLAFQGEKTGKKKRGCDTGLASSVRQRYLLHQIHNQVLH